MKRLLLFAFLCCTCLTSHAQEQLTNYISDGDNQRYILQTTDDQDYILAIDQFFFCAGIPSCHCSVDKHLQNQIGQ